MSAAETTIPPPPKHLPPWFQLSQSTLLPLIHARNRAFDNYYRDPTSPELHSLLQISRSQLRRAVRDAKHKWQCKIAEQLTSERWRHDPKAAWQAIRTIESSFTGHFRRPNVMNMQLPNGRSATTDAENLSVFTPHFNKIFNGDSLPIDIPAILAQIPQRPVQHNLDHPPTAKELDIQLKKMQRGKAPGISGVTAEALKHLPDDAKQILLTTLQQIYHGHEDPPSWHTATLTCLYKNKGDSSLPTNWRGICLKDLTSRIMSGILSTRLLKIIQLHGVDTQYGSQPGRGTQDALFVIRSALQTRRYHNLPTWGLFVDLVKAFDTANHDLLFALLSHYGAPPSLVSIIRTLYTDVSVQLQIGKQKSRIPYTIGVQQGDNMAPVLFLFLMQAFAESLEPKWTTANLSPPEFRQPNPNKTSTGTLLGQNPNTAGLPFSLFYLLYVDDGAFLFQDLDSLIRGANLLYHHFRTFGLRMHIATSPTETSKTKVVYFPPSLRTEDYSADLNMHIPVADGHITFTRRFRYLGAWLCDTLRDTYEIQTRIAKATAQVASLQDFFRSPHIPLYLKRRIYLAIPFNTALYGCESWTLTENDRRLLTTFHHKSIRRILNISMLEVWLDSVTNETVRQRFRITDILDTVTRRQLLRIGKVTRMGSLRTPRRLLGSWIHHPRRPGRPQQNYRHTYAQAIHHIVPDCDPDRGHFSTWFDHAIYCNQWNTALDTWWQSCLSASCAPTTSTSPASPTEHRYL